MYQFEEVTKDEGLAFAKELNAIYEAFDNVYSICVVNQFSQSPLPVEEQADITETALEDYSDFDYVIANEDQTNLRDKVFKFLEDIE